MVKKLIEYLFVMFALCFCLNIDVQAVDDWEENYTYYTLEGYSDNVTYTLDFGLNHKKKIAAVIGFKTRAGFDGHVDIPSEVKFATDGVTEDTYTVVGIKKTAFKENVNLYSINLPDTVTFLAGYSFYDCSNLKSVRFGSELCQVDEHCFDYCSSLTEVDFSNTKLFTINQYAFSACSELTKVTLPESLKYIGKGAFNVCSQLTSLELPKNIQQLGVEFISGTNITELFVPKSVTTDGVSRSLAGANSLKSVTLEEGITIVPNGLFKETDLDVIVLPSTIIKFGDYSFKDASLPENFSIPETVTSLGIESMSGITFRADFKLPDSIKIMYQEAFANSTFLGELVLPSSLEELGYRVFWCTELYNSKLELPSSLKKISSDCFSGCQVVEIVINSDLEDANEAFTTWWSCTNYIEKVTFAEGVKVVPNDIFRGSEIEEVCLPSTIESIGYNAFKDSKIKNNLVIPSGVTVIEENTFAGCTELSSVIVGNNIKIIEHNAFNGSALEEFVIPDSVEVVENKAFANCQYLKNLTLSAGLDDESLERLLGEGLENTPELESLEIPYGFTSIKGLAHTLDSLYIPESVTDIDNTVTSDIVNKIVGVKGSYAETYAIQEGIPFEEGVEVVDFTVITKARTMTLNEELPLEISTSPRNIKNNVFWSSSDEAIVSVTNTGVVKALKPGTATITVMIDDLVRTIDIKVLKPIEKISMTTPYLRVVGQKMKLKVTVEPFDAEETYYLHDHRWSDCYSVDEDWNIIATKTESAFIALELRVNGTNTLEESYSVNVFGNIGVPVLELESSSNTDRLVWANNWDDCWKNDYGHEGIELFRYNRETDDWTLFKDIQTGVVAGTQVFNLRTTEGVIENINEGENVFKARYYVFDKDDNKMYGEFSEEVSYNYGKSEETEEETPTDKPEEETPTDKPEEPSAEELFKAQKIVAKLDKDSNGYSLVWNNVDADGYEIYVANSSGKYSLWVTIRSGFRNYLPKTLTPEKYTYIVKGYKVFGSKKVYCKQSTNIKYTINLTTVKSLKQKTTFTNKIEMSWGKVVGATGYEIWRANTKNAKYSKVTSTVGTNGKQYVIGGSAYYYKVRAYKKLADGSILYGAYSTPTKLYSKPSTVDIKVSKVGSTKIKVTWTKSVGANNYDIYMSNSKSGTYRLVKTRKSTHNKYYTFTNLSRGKTYYFKIRTYKIDGSGNKVYSNWSTVKSVKLNK